MTFNQCILDILKSRLWYSSNQILYLIENKYGKRTTHHIQRISDLILIRKIDIARERREDGNFYYRLRTPNHEIDFKKCKLRPPDRTPKYPTQDTKPKSVKGTVRNAVGQGDLFGGHV